MADDNVHIGCSGVVSPFSWGPAVDQPTHQLAVLKHCSGALAHWGFIIVEQEPVAVWLPLKELIMAFVAINAVVQHHPPKAIYAAPLIVESACRAEFGHGQLHRVLQAGSGLHCTSLDPLHDDTHSLS